MTDEPTTPPSNQAPPPPPKKPAASDREPDPAGDRRHSNLAAAAFVLALAFFVIGFGRQFIPYELRDVTYIAGLVYFAVLLLSASCLLGALLKLWLSNWRIKGLDPALTALGILLFCLWIFQFPELMPTPKPVAEDPVAACKRNVTALAQGVLEYDNLHGQWPYDARGPLFSLSLLYPKFVTDPIVFRCPSRGEEETRRFPIGCTLAGKQCSYGYDNEFNALQTKPEMPMAGDLPGNHGAGAHVMTFDGQVTFTNTFVLGEDPPDNIYVADEGAEPPTDAYIRQ